MPVVGGYEHLAGRRLPDGHITLGAHTAWLWAYCIDASPDVRVPHPSMGWYLAQHGCGLDIVALLALLDAEPDDGPLLGEIDLEWHAPLRAGAAYRVAGTIEGVERKHGRSGAFDRVVVRLEVLDDVTGAPACTLWNTTIVPRR